MIIVVWVLRFLWLGSLCAGVLLLGRYVHPAWYTLMPFAVLAGWPNPDYTPKELQRRAVEEALRDVEWRRRQQMSPEYRIEQIDSLLYQRAQTGDVEAMKAYLDHQGRRPRPDWTPTDIMLGNG